jgi:hypothetical protein
MRLGGIVPQEDEEDDNVHGADHHGDHEGRQHELTKYDLRSTSMVRWSQKNIKRSTHVTPTIGKIMPDVLCCKCVNIQSFPGYARH